MIITLKFDSEKEEDMNLYKLYTKTDYMSLALWDIKLLLSRRLKYELDTKSSEVYDEVEKLSKEINDILTEYELHSITD